MERLTVLYDENCAFCVRCAQWLVAQEAYVPLECVPAGSPHARRRFGELRRAKKQELVVVDDRGGVYREADAFLMCLFALVEYRKWALRLAAPALRPLARSAFELLSSNRTRLSAWLWNSRDEAIATELQTHYGDPSAPKCGTNGDCQPA